MGARYGRRKVPGMYADINAPLDTCRRCGGQMRPGIGMAQTFTGGVPDFPGDTHAATYSPGGPGEVIPCRKCADCGWSVTGETGDSMERLIGAVEAG